MAHFPPPTRDMQIHPNFKRPIPPASLPARRPTKTPKQSSQTRLPNKTPPTKTVPTKTVPAKNQPSTGPSCPDPRTPARRRIAMPSHRAPAKGASEPRCPSLRGLERFGRGEVNRPPLCQDSCRVSLSGRSPPEWSRYRGSDIGDLSPLRTEDLRAPPRGRRHPA